METTYYNRSNNFSAPIRKEPKPFVPKTLCTDGDFSKQDSDCRKEKKEDLKNIVKNDDLLILALLFLFLSDSNNDTLLLLALLYLLLFSSSK